MITSKPNDWREYRRMRAYELKGQGYTQAQIAQILDVSEGAVSQWFSRVEEADGDQTVLRHRKPPGPASKLSLEQLAEIPKLLLKGASEYGFTGDIWTGSRVAWLIKFKYDVTYHPKHVCRLLKLLGWTPQKPVEKAVQRDEEAIARFKAQRWLELKKKPKTKVLKSSS
jgi:transposase